jgi:hypothetical protein
MEFMPCPQPVQLVDAVYYDPWLTQFARRPAKQSKSRQPQDDPGPFADLLFWGLMRRFMPKALSFLLPGLALLFARSCPFPPHLGPSLHNCATMGESLEETLHNSAAIVEFQVMQPPHS